jgi:hypothetical protein
MTRCKKGTRKNKTTGKCEKHDRAATLRASLKLCIERKKKVTNIRELTGKKLIDYSNLVEKCSKLQDKIDNLDPNRTLSDNDITGILDRYARDEDKPMLRQKLCKLKFDKKYVEELTGKKSTNLYNQVGDKVYSFYKYGTDIV